MCFLYALSRGLAWYLNDRGTLADERWKALKWSRPVNETIPHTPHDDALGGRMFANIEGACPSERVERLSKRCMYAKLVRMARKKSCFQKNTNRQADRQPGATYYCQRTTAVIGGLCYDCHWRPMDGIGDLWLSLARYGCYWRDMVVIGEL